MRKGILTLFILIITVIIANAQGKKVDFSMYQQISSEDVEKEITTIIEKNPDAKFSVIMGTAMARFRGKVDGRLVSEIIKKKIS